MPSYLKKIIVLSALATSSVIFAQTLGTEAPLYIKITPEFPDPGVDISASLISYNTDLNLASITWTLDGKVLARGTAIKEVKFKAAAHGSKNTLRAVATSPEGAVFESTLIIQPQSVDIIIEGSTQAPYWYRGALLPSVGNQVTVVAIPNFITGKTRPSSASLIYEWRTDGRLRQDLSGRGRDSISIASPAAGTSPIDIEGKVSSTDKTLVKNAKSEIRGYAPEVYFYERGAEGLNLSSAIRTKLVRAGDVFAVEAIPFFMNYSSRADVGYNWKLNNQNTNSIPSDPSAISIETLPESGGQSATVEVLVTNAKNVYEQIVNRFNVSVQ